MPANSFAIIARDLCYQDAGGRQLLSGLNFEIPKGQRVAILGAAGAGKSLLLAALNGLLPFSGSLAVNGLRLPGTSVARLRQEIGLVFQEPAEQLFSTTVFENIAVGLHALGTREPELSRRVQAMLKLFDLEEDAQRNALGLGGGETKRVAIAAELVREPAILCLDEPCAGLDHGCSQNLQAQLGRYSGTMLLASHDLRMAGRLTERALVLKRGQLAADLSTQELLDNEKLRFDLDLLI